MVNKISTHYTEVNRVWKHLYVRTSQYLSLMCNRFYSNSPSFKDLLIFISQKIKIIKKVHSPHLERMITQIFESLSKKLRFSSKF